MYTGGTELFCEVPVMVRHIVSWNYKDGLTEEEKRAHAEMMQTELNKLKQSLDGVLEVKVYADLCASSNRDIMLDSLFESEATLEAYQVHPEHQRLIRTVGALLQDRACVDYLV